MNILLIGNGFDLAHKLPTTYSDFLDFCKYVSKIFTITNRINALDFFEQSMTEWETNQVIKDLLFEGFKSRKNNRVYNNDGTYLDEFITTNDFINELNLLIDENIWIEYFYECSSYIGSNWIDFESEISRVVQALDETRILVGKNESLQSATVDTQKTVMQMAKKFNGRLNDVCGSIEKIDEFTSILYKDLKRMIRALELYLTEFVGKIDSNVIIPEIDKLHIDYVLSFNYTNTYEKIYGEGKKIEYDYIHGKASTMNSVESNNMVLGIDEYLSKERMSKETYFLPFKKFYQRILKSTGCDYYDWLDKIDDEYNFAYQKACSVNSIGMLPDIVKTGAFYSRSNLYIFGHSLDVTDGDVLRKLICNDSICTKIFYYRQTEDDRNTLEKLITNLVKVIGPEELIMRTGGSSKSIEFIPQSLANE